MYGRFLTEADCDYLLARGFSGWQKFLIDQYYRVELNVNDQVLHPLPLSKNLTQTFVNTSCRNIVMDVEGDIRIKVEPKDPEEKKRIVQTRDKLS